MNALWWWIDRWRKSTAYTDMTLEEQGAYRNLLDEAQLRGGPLPNDERILAKACGDALAWKRVKAAVMVRFTLTAEGWRNETLDEVIRESQRRADKQQRYRHKRGNDGGTSGGNTTGNDGGNRGGSPDPDPDPDLSPESTSTGAARRSVENPVEISEGTFGLYCLIADEARATSLREDQSESLSNIAAIFKGLCAQRRITYDSDIAARAIDAVLARVPA